MSASVTLSSQFTTPLAIGRYLIQPNTTYKNTDINFGDPAIAAAIAKGLLVFNDGVSTMATFVASPTVQSVVAVVDAQQATQASAIPGADTSVPASDESVDVIQE